MDQTNECTTNIEGTKAPDCTQPGAPKPDGTLSAVQPRKRGRPRKVMSAAAVEANRRNAGRSTGAKSDRGKRNSRKNAKRHGLFAQLTLEGADRDRLDEIYRALAKDLKPVGAVEKILATQLATDVWRLEKALCCEQGHAITELAARAPAAELPALEIEAIKAQIRLPFGENLDRLLRYETTFHRRLLSNLGTLERLQKARKEKEEETEAAEGNRKPE